MQSFRLIFHSFTFVAIMRMRSTAELMNDKQQTNVSHTAISVGRLQRSSKHWLLILKFLFSVNVRCCRSAFSALGAGQRIQQKAFADICKSSLIQPVLS